MGFCFGGTTALEMGRTGTDLAGVISFHGGLSTPNLADAKNIKARTLVMHGALDPFVKEKEITDFEKSMNEAGVDYQFVKYSGAVHSFTNPKAGNDIKAGAAYNATADKRSFALLKSFLSEIFN